MNAIVAVSQDWGIGYHNHLLFHISPDMRRFRSMTLGKTVILGRKTLESMPGGVPLKGRGTILLSQTPGIKAEGALICRSADQLLQAVKNKDPDSLFVIGGEKVYRTLLPCCDQVFVTKVRAQPPADRFFPDLDAMPDWHLEEAEPWETFDGISYRYVRYRRGDSTSHAAE